MDLFDIAVAKKLAGGGGGGGGGDDSLTLLNTTDLGALNITSTTEATLTQLQVSNIDDYEVLFVLCKCSEKRFGYHLASINAIFLSGTSNYHTKTNGNTASTIVNYSNFEGADIRSKVYSAGVYAGTSPTVNNGTITITIKAKANTSNVGIIDGNYTAKVYGAKLADLLNL